jgi:uncharacterized membrane protein YtjA (UPF0391 family)
MVQQLLSMTFEFAKINRRYFMLRAAIAFFVLALISIILGANNLAGVSMDIGKVLLTVFLALAIISFLISMFTGRTPKSMP